MNDFTSDKVSAQAGAVQILNNEDPKRKKTLPSLFQPVPAKGTTAFLALVRDLKKDLGKHRVIPALDGRPLCNWKNGEAAEHLPSGELWRRANMIAVMLDKFLIVDMDEYKAEFDADKALPLRSDLAKFQYNDKPSTHYLYRMPDDATHQTFKYADNGYTIKGVDLKWGIQLVYIKPGKFLTKLPFQNVPRVPESILKILRHDNKKQTTTEAPDAQRQRWLAKFARRPEYYMEQIENSLQAVSDEEGRLPRDDSAAPINWIGMQLALRTFLGTEWEEWAIDVAERFSDEDSDVENRMRNVESDFRPWEYLCKVRVSNADLEDGDEQPEVTDESNRTLPTYLGGELNREISKDEALRLGAMNEKFTMTVHKGGRTSIAHKVEKDFGAAEWTFIAPEAFITSHLSDFPIFGRVETDQGLKDGRPVNIGKAWLHWPGRNAKMNGVGLYPPPLAAPGGVLNLWQGYRVQPSAGDTAPFLHLVQTVLCSGDGSISDYWLQWMAHMFQKPAEKPSVAVALVGDYGSGKGTIGKVLSDLLGGMATQQTGLNAATGKFNSILAEKILLVADEVKTRSGEQADALKNIISEAKAYFEGKGVDGRDGRSFLRVQINSNHEDAIKLTKGDRRFLVPRIDNTYAGNRDNPEHLTKSKPYWDRFNAWWERGENKSAVLHYLLTMDLSAFDPYNAPHSERAADIIAASMDRLDEWLLSQLAPGHILDGTEVNGASLLAAYRSSMERHRVPESRADKALSSLIGTRLGSMGAGSPVGHGSARRRKMPDWETGRRKFCDKLGINYTEPETGDVPPGTDDLDD